MEMIDFRTVPVFSDKDKERFSPLVKRILEQAGQETQARIMEILNGFSSNNKISLGTIIEELDAQSQKDILLGYKKIEERFNEFTITTPVFICEDEDEDKDTISKQFYKLLFLIQEEKKELWEDVLDEVVKAFPSGPEKLGISFYDLEKELPNELWDALARAIYTYISKESPQSNFDETNQDASDSLERKTA